MNNNTHGFTNYAPSMISFYNRERNKLLSEISLLAINPDTNRIAALGNEVLDKRDMIEREGMVVGSPFRNGIVAEFDLARKLFEYFLKKINVRRLFRLRAAVCVPVEMTQVEQRVLTELMYCVKAQRILIINESYMNAVAVIPDKYELIIEIMPEATPE